MFDDGVHHPLFLGPKHKLDLNRDKIWFLKTHVDKNTLGLLSKCLTKDILELMGKKKLQTNLGVKLQSPGLEVGMIITGHRDPKSYQK